MVERFAKELDGGTRPFANNSTPPKPNEANCCAPWPATPIRTGLETHFHVRLDCHRLAAFPTHAEATLTYRQFTSERAQLLNQSSELRNC